MKSLLISLVVSSFVPAPCNDPAANTNLTTMESIDTVTYPVTNISISINRSAQEVYDFASNPENFPRWVAFIKSMKKQGDSWLGTTGTGDIKITFGPRNDFGIIDHQVTFFSGETVNNPMRAVANNKGCEFVFTLFKMPGKTDEEFNEDAKAVTEDLQTLKRILEQ